MSNKTEGEFTFIWDIGTVNELYEVKFEDSFASPIVEAKTLKCSKWYLQLYRSKVVNIYFTCYLHRLNTPKSDNIFESITYKLEMIDADGRILKSVVKKNCIFSKGSSSEVHGFLDTNALNLYRKRLNRDTWSKTQVVTIRCHIIDETYKKQAITWEVPTTIHTQWKIKTPELLNWSKKIKVPFHECTHIEIIMSASDERIDMKIEEANLLKPYQLKITVLDDEDREIDFKGSKNVFQSNDEDQKLETWIEKSQLVNESRFHLPYSFTLICIISTSSINSVSDIESCSRGNPIDESLPLQEDLKEMLLSEKHSDVKLRVHEEILPAHKCLLSVRSPVFSTMFDQDMLETQTGIVDIPDVDLETLRAFLEFLYTDMITITDCEEVLKLMLVADKYQVNVLKERCAEILLTKLSIENICEVVSVAEMVNHSKLKLSAINFIKANKIIISSPLWSEWMKRNMELANEVLLKLLID